MVSLAVLAAAGLAACGGSDSLRPLGDAEVAPPNLVLVVVDTLRRDRLGVYGYEPHTSPEIDRHLGRRGVVVDSAYAQAPWTLPSMISLVTGRSPAEVVRGDYHAYAIPREVPTLAEHLQELGYDTAAFLANPTLRESNGFGRGFTTVETVPASEDSMFLHADHLYGRLVPWLEERVEAQRGGAGAEPFFLYAHFIDPHDPYENPELIHGRSPAHLFYKGKLTGRHIHGLFKGEHRLLDEEADVGHLSALYDAEVRYVDRFVGELFDRLPRKVLANTLVVLTSDHGEELYDHGGWKHGRTLYQEQVHVPLLFRWDGVLPAGRRLRGTARLLDLLPTLVAAARGGADATSPQAVAQELGLPGRNLLPALRGDVPDPALIAYAQHFNSGPLRAAAVAGRRKLIAFDKHARYSPGDPLERYLYGQELERLERLEIYNLKDDPGERVNLARAPEARAEAAAAVERLFPVIHRQLDEQIPGLRVVVRDLVEGSLLRGTVRLSAPPAGFHSYFLGEQDRARLDGSTLHLELHGELGHKGVVVEDPGEALAEITFELDGRPLPPEQIHLASAGDASGLEDEGPRALADLAMTRWPTPEAGDSGGPSVVLWVPAEPVVEASGEVDPEVVKAMKALGYL